MNLFYHLESYLNTKTKTQGKWLHPSKADVNKVWGTARDAAIAESSLIAWQSLYKKGKSTHSLCTNWVPPCTITGVDNSRVIFQELVSQGSQKRSENL